MENKIKFQILRKIGGAFFLLALVFVLAQMVLAKDNTGYFKIKDSYIEIQETDYPQNVALVKKENGKEEIAGQVKIVDQYLISDLPENEFLDEYSYLKQGFQDLTISLETDQPLFEKENFYYSSSLLDKTKSFFGFETLPEYRITKEVDKSASVQTELDLKNIKVETHYQELGIENNELRIKQTLTFTNESDQDLNLALLLKNQVEANKIYWNNQEYIITENARKFVNPDKVSFGKSFYDFSDVTDEFEPELWAERKNSITNLILSLNVSILAGETITIDPTYGVEITILNVHSHPQAGDNWTVSFKTKGTANLTITPDDQESIDDLGFVSLKCGNEERTPQILEGDVIFYPNWQCDGTGETIHLVNVAKNHVLKFQFGDEIAYAYNSPETETLRPDAAGDETNIPGETPSGSDHYLLVDEAEADDDTTKVYPDYNFTWVRDLYNIAVHSAGSGVVNHITVYAHCWCNSDLSRTYLKIAIKAGTGTGAPDTPSESDSISVSTLSWENYSHQWDENPATESAFTWDEIDKLQIGITLYGATAVGRVECTQVYVVVDYTLNVAPTVSSVSLNNGGDITLTPNDTTSVSATATVTDENGYGNIDTVTGKIYRSGVSGAEGCTNDNNDCYEDASCDLTGCDGNSCTATCTIDMEYYADPTDAGSYSGQYWRAWVEVTDEAEETGSAYSPADSPDVETQLAFSLSVVETLRPNGVGISTELTAYPGTGEDNYEDVDEASSDGDSTYVWHSQNIGSDDYYTIPNSVLDAGTTINKVTLFGLCRAEAGSPILILGLRIGDTDYNSSEITVSETSYTLKSKEWTVDPSDSNSWTVAKINAIQNVRVWMSSAASPNYLRCTQVYVEVDYTPATPTINYGTMSLGTNTGTTNQKVNIINTGNVQMDVEFSGTNMGCSSGSIPVGNQKYDKDESPSADYSNLEFQLTDSAEERDWDALQRTDDSSQQQGSDKKWSYWGIEIPATGVGGSCSGTATFTAVNDQQ